MKGVLILLLMLLTVGCDLVKDEAITISERPPRSILTREVGGGQDVFLSEGSALQKLFELCDLDCNERIRENDWSPSGLHHAFRITNSNRYRSTHRLLLFSFTQPRARALVDDNSTRVSGFRFTDSTFVYVREGGAEVTVRLE